MNKYFLVMAMFLAGCAMPGKISGTWTFKGVKVPLIDERKHVIYGTGVKLDEEFIEIAKTSSVNDGFLPYSTLSVLVDENFHPYPESLADNLLIVKGIRTLGSIMNFQNENLWVADIKSIDVPAAIKEQSKNSSINDIDTIIIVQPKDLYIIKNGSVIPYKKFIKEAAP